ncbi:hypothetical protein [Paenibacillus ginsengihumi]|uniref:hypothetical protein n=1 Tax=Paenibacillus ginsengihumi TaxID=431596 RepID=UPI00036B196B|nr:hypothetical protein [Paenibacillus ginsengihumi]
MSDHFQRKASFFYGAYAWNPTRIEKKMQAARAGFPLQPALFLERCLSGHTRANRRHILQKMHKIQHSLKTDSTRKTTAF